MRYLFIIMFLTITLGSLIYYQFSPNAREYFAEETKVDDEYIKTLEAKGPTGLSVDNIQEETVFNKFTKREKELERLRGLLTSSHEMEEKSFDHIKKNSLNQSTVFDNNIFDGTIYHEHKEGEYSGITKCHDECQGNCLEFGHTGHAWCFPIIK